MFSSVLVVFFGLLSLLFLFVSGLVVDPEFDDPELEPELVLEPVPELVLEPEFPSEGGVSTGFGSETFMVFLVLEKSLVVLFH